MAATRNFEFRVSPRSGQRSGRFYIDAPTLIGAPVVVADDADPTTHEMELVKVELATGAQAPVPGLSGICVFEYIGPDGWAGNDQFLTTYSDLDTAPAGKAVQVVSGDEVKVAFRNTEDRTFLNTRAYEGRVMVAGAGTVAIGDYLTPGPGTDAGGYWAETADVANAWLVVTSVDTSNGQVEARMMF